MNRIYRHIEYHIIHIIDINSMNDRYDPSIHTPQLDQVFQSEIKLRSIHLLVDEPIDRAHL